MLRFINAFTVITDNEDLENILEVMNYGNENLV